MPRRGRRTRVAFTAFLVGGGGAEKVTRPIWVHTAGGSSLAGVSSGSLSEALRWNSEGPSQRLGDGPDGLLIPSLLRVEAPITYLYWIVSEVVDARNFVIRILTMLNRNTKLIWREKGREGKRKSREVGTSWETAFSPATPWKSMSMHTPVPPVTPAPAWGPKASAPPF